MGMAKIEAAQQVQQQEVTQAQKIDAPRGIPSLKLGGDPPASEGQKPKPGFGLDLTKARNIQQENLNRVDLIKQE